MILTEKQKVGVKNLMLGQYKKKGLDGLTIAFELADAVEDVINHLEKKDLETVVLDGNEVQMAATLFATLRIGEQQRLKIDGKVKYRHEADYIMVAIVNDDVKFVKDCTAYTMSYLDGSSSDHTHAYSTATDDDMQKIIDYLYF